MKNRMFRRDPLAGLAARFMAWAAVAIALAGFAIADFELRLRVETIEAAAQKSLSETARWKWAANQVVFLDKCLVDCPCAPGQAWVKAECRHGRKMKLWCGKDQWKWYEQERVGLESIEEDGSTTVHYYWMRTGE